MHRLILTRPEEHPMEQGFTREHTGTAGALKVLGPHELSPGPLPAGNCHGHPDFVPVGCSGTSTSL
jgi:hypothetical protein